MFKPKSTYRIQFHKDFNLYAFNKIIPYLVSLGIDTVYASPIFEAVPGSTHGYDVVNPLRLNPEIGTEVQLLEIAAKLKTAGISWLQDIVPNHMAFHPSNKWLMDVLENGPASEYAPYFDIDFMLEGGKVMVPFLETSFDQSIEDGAVSISKQEEKYFLNTSGMQWPLNAASTAKLKKGSLEELNESKSEILQIAEQQHYRLCAWNETDSKINYRRFFTVNGLICLNIQDVVVFKAYHQYIFSLVDKGIFQGLRIDHIDGLYDPKKYIDNLREAAGKDLYIVVEKILEQGEELPQSWEVQGTTGYDFLAQINNLFTNKAAVKPFEKTYREVTGKKLDPNTLIREKKKAILYGHMQGELNNLFALFLSLNLVEIKEAEKDELRKTIGELMIGMPVYRYYSYVFPLTGESRENLVQIFEPMLKDKTLEKSAKLLYNALLEEPLNENDDYNVKIGRFYQRLMQFTGPLMAKGVEDTAMFTYNRFIGHSEVGDAPDSFGITKGQFHQYMLDRFNNWPLTMNGSSTHDTKKGEDVRARLNVLTDLYDEWDALVAELQISGEALSKDFPDFKSLHPNDIYMVIQTLVGAFPFPNMDADDIENRLGQFIQKALREAKKRSDWAEPDHAYEEQLTRFALLLADEKYPFREKIIRFLQQIADFAVVNSLAQLVLKFTCPGIPDVYQGSELWDLSLVDPDNRRPVDYGLRTEYLNDMVSATPKALWEERLSGKIKLWLTKNLLELRNTENGLFEEGTYIPLKTIGRYSANVFAFARKFKDSYILIAVPLGAAYLCREQEVELKDIDWQDTQILLPDGAPLGWSDLLNKKDGHKDFLREGIDVGTLFKVLPVAVIKLIPKQNKRAAGILLPVHSLPSAFGIGDFGQEAYKFIDFLHQSRHQYWQVLPLNPVLPDKGHSAYSSPSAMAGNLLLISPEELYNDGLIDQSDIENAVQANADRINYQETQKNKSILLKKAFENFTRSAHKELLEEFDAFCLTEKDWLDDYALFVALGAYFKEQNWYKWPADFKFRDSQKITAFTEKSSEELRQIKWEQFIFFGQWHKLKEYANKKSVKLIGDLPFYPDYGSVEVWSKPENFNLDADKKMITVAGVPPDYFNSGGQLWGMPTFKFTSMEENDYGWWVNRIKKNLERFDIIRLDHFRGFSAYWEVNAGDESAINGTWKPGPGEKLFTILKKSLKELPLIAEDLGEITDDVNKLRDKFGLPGMKVLQFAFGADLPSSPNIPHNFINTNSFVYTGTHDNNTVRGWYDSETDQDTRLRISEYFGFQVDHTNIGTAMLNLAYSAAVDTVVVPLQDVLGLGGNSRINLPGTAEGNWEWKLEQQMPWEEIAQNLLKMAERTARA